MRFYYVPIFFKIILCYVYLYIKYISYFQNNLCTANVYTWNTLPIFDAFIFNLYDINPDEKLLLYAK